MANPSDIKPLTGAALESRNVRMARILGREELRDELIKFLQDKYMAPLTERGTPRAQAILEVTKEVCEFLRKR